MDLLAHAPGVPALLLAFGMSLSGRSWPWLYAAQCILAAASSLAVAIQADDPWPALATLVLLVQSVAIPRLLREAPAHAPPSPAATLCGGIVLTALALSLSLPGPFAVALSMILLGLLDAALARSAGPGRFGILLLLIGAQLAAGGPLAVLVLAVLASVVASEGLPRLGTLR